MSTAPQDPAPAPAPAYAPAKPQRSKVERAIVWGVIGILGIVMLLEGLSWLSFRRAHSALLSELQKAETSDYRITSAKVKEIVGDREPDISKDVDAIVGKEHYDVYVYKGLLKERPLCVHYGVAAHSGEEPEVIEVTSIIPDELF
jgi:hypothetical protein